MLQIAWPLLSGFDDTILMQDPVRDWAASAAARVSATKEGLVLPQDSVLCSYCQLILNNILIYFKVLSILHFGPGLATTNALTVRNLNSSRASLPVGAAIS